MVVVKVEKEMMAVLPDLVLVIYLGQLVIDTILGQVTRSEAASGANNVMSM